MKTINKVVGNLRVFACQIQENLVIRIWKEIDRRNKNENT